MHIAQERAGLRLSLALQPRSGCEPILDVQPFNATELAHIVGDQDRIQGDRMGSDQIVERTDRCPGGRKCCAQRAKAPRCLSVEWGNFERQQEIFDRRTIRLAMGASRRTEAELCQNDG